MIERQKKDTKIHLHVGFHKTASTYIQSFLGENRKNLSDSNCVFWRPRDLRPEFTNLVGRIALGKGDMKAWNSLKKWRDNFLDSNADIVIISEENLIGMCGEPYTKGGVYPYRCARMRVLQELFGGLDVSIFCGVRSPVGYFPAAYCETIRHQPFITWDQYTRSLNFRKFRWSDIVKDISSCFPQSSVHVWTYENFTSSLPAIIDRLAGDEIFQKLQPPAQNVVYPSLSHKSIEAMNALRSALSPAEISKVRHCLEQQFKKGETYPAYDPWDSTEKKLFEKEYADDVKVMERVFNVDILDVQNA